MKESKRDVLIVSAVRTAIGDFGGELRDASHTDLASLVMGEVCRRADFPKEKVDDIYWGTVMARSDENSLSVIRLSKRVFPITCRAPMSLGPAVRPWRPCASVPWRFAWGKRMPLFQAAERA